MGNKRKLLLTLLTIVLAITLIILYINNQTNNTFDDYTEYDETEYDIDNMFNEELIPTYEKNVVEVYLVEHKEELIEKGVPEEFFDSIEITMHNDSVYTIVAGDKMITIGLTEDGEVEYCNVY